MVYKLIDCCPAPEELYDELVVLKSDTGCVFNSLYRGTDARALLEQCGKHDQAWLYANLPPGVANPPGRSTHELRSDGVAYEGPVGRVLPYWCCGIDLDDAHVASFIAAARKRGWIVTITYPGSSVEYHHVNFRKEPDFPTFDALKKGDSGDRVKKLVDKLAFIHRPHKYGDDSYLPDAQGDLFNDQVVRAVKMFQKDHHLTDDGVVGKHTWQQILVSERVEKRNRQINALKNDLNAVQHDLAEQRDKKPRTKEIEKKIKELTAKADKLRDQIKQAGGNPG